MPKRASVSQVCRHFSIYLERLAHSPGSVTVSHTLHPLVMELEHTFHQPICSLAPRASVSPSRIRTEI